MAKRIFLPYRRRLAGGTEDWVADDLRVILVTTGHSSAVLDEFVTDITTLNEATGTGYVAGPGGSGRLALQTKTVFQDDGGLIVRLRADNLLWLSLQNDIARLVGAIVYRHVSGVDDSLNELIVFDDENGFPFTPNGSNFELTVPTTGLLTI